MDITFAGATPDKQFSVSDAFTNQFNSKIKP